MIGLSKGLMQISIELNLNLNNLKLPELRKELSKHPAFSNQTKLEILAKKYNVKILFCPKYHCIINAIEGFWCSLKQYIRKNPDSLLIK